MRPHQNQFSVIIRNANASYAKNAFYNQERERERERDGPKPMGLLVQVLRFELGAVDFTKKPAVLQHCIF